MTISRWRAYPRIPWVVNAVWFGPDDEYIRNRWQVHATWGLPGKEFRLRQAMADHRLWIVAVVLALYRIVFDPIRLPSGG